MFFFNYSEKKEEEREEQEPDPFKILHPLKDNNVKITSPFGDRIHPVTKKAKKHNGVDFRARLETPIYAVCDFFTMQTVTKEHEGIMIRGNHIDAATNEHYIFVYCHLGHTVKIDHAKKGDLIGFTGNSGASTGPHLHFGVWVYNNVKDKWVSIDPMELIKND